MLRLIFIIALTSIYIYGNSVKDNMYTYNCTQESKFISNYVIKDQRNKDKNEYVFNKEYIRCAKFAVDVYTRALINSRFWEQNIKSYKREGVLSPEEIKRYTKIASGNVRFDILPGKKFKSNGFPLDLLKLNECTSDMSIYGFKLGCPITSQKTMKIDTETATLNKKNNFMIKLSPKNKLFTKLVFEIDEKSQILYSVSLFSENLTKNKCKLLLENSLLRLNKVIKDKSRKISLKDTNNFNISNNDYLVSARCYEGGYSVIEVSSKYIKIIKEN